MTLNELEALVLNKFLDGDSFALDVLRQQLQGVKVLSREFTGAGFYTHFEVDRRASRLITLSKFVLSGVSGSAANVQHGVGFVLFLRAGALDFLEGFTYDEPWPEQLIDLHLEYANFRGENLADLNRAAVI